MTTREWPFTLRLNGLSPHSSPLPRRAASRLSKRMLLGLLGLVNVGRSLKEGRLRIAAACFFRRLFFP